MTMKPRPQDIFETRAQPLVAGRTGLLIIDAQNWVMDEENRPASPRVL